MDNIKNKERVRHIILEELERHDEVFVTEDILHIGFPEIDPYNEAVTIMAFSAQAKPAPPLTFDELVRQFCRTNNLEFKMLPQRREGRFAKKALDKTRPLCDN